MHFSPVLRRYVLILGRSVSSLTVVPTVASSYRPIVRVILMADQIVYMKLELHEQGIQEGELQQINCSGRTMVSTYMYHEV
jgi:hypothetical protein